MMENLWLFPSAPGGTRGTQRDIKAEEEVRPVRIKEEDIPTEISRDPGVNRWAPEEVEAENEEETYVRIKVEEIPLEISSVKEEENATEFSSYIEDSTDTRETQRCVKAEEEESPTSIKDEEIPMEISRVKEEEILTASRTMNSAGNSIQSSIDISSVDQSSTVNHSFLSNLNIREQIEREVDLDGLSMSSESEITSEEDEEDGDTEDKQSSEAEETTPKRLRPSKEQLDAFFQQLQDQIFPPGSSMPQCFQNDPERTPPPSPPLKQDDSKPVTLDGWCHCHNCKMMPTEEECMCCHALDNVYQFVTNEIKCITCVDEFKQRCQNGKILQYVLEADSHTTKQEFENNRNRCLRKAAYRQFNCMVHGFPGKKKRFSIPSCVVWAIRHTFPEPTGNYVGFHWPSDLPASDMALIS